MASKVALITGAGTGIGKAAALALFKVGYSLVLAGRRLEPLETTVSELHIQNSRVLVVSTDVTDTASVQKLFTKTQQKFGRLDVLFNNAGVGNAPTLLEDLSYEEWRRVLDTNVTG